MLLTQQFTWERKVKEMILALEISRRYSKEQILEMYLNEIPYGNLAYGIEAAAQSYFGKTTAGPEPGRIGHAGNPATLAVGQLAVHQLARGQAAAGDRAR